MWLEREGTTVVNFLPSHLIHTSLKTSSVLIAKMSRRRTVKQLEDNASVLDFLTSLVPAQLLSTTSIIQVMSSRRKSYCMKTNRKKRRRNVDIPPCILDFVLDSATTHVPSCQKKPSTSKFEEFTYFSKWVIFHRSLAQIRRQQVREEKH
jgi:hypothetical protein